MTPRDDTHRHKHGTPTRPVKFRNLPCEFNEASRSGLRILDPRQTNGALRNRNHEAEFLPKLTILKRPWQGPHVSLTKQLG